MVLEHIPLFGLAEPINALTHFLAAAATLFAGAYLLRRSPKVGKERVALFTYLICLLLLFTFSGLYHSYPPGEMKRLFRHLDFAAIFLVIAGTMSAIQILLLRGMWRIGTIVLAWGLAVSGMLVIDSYAEQMPFWMISGLYMAIGLSGCLTFYRLLQIIGFKRAFALAAGGAFYLVGAIIDTVEAPLIIPGVFGSHEIFHLCVVLGAACHYGFIYAWAGLRLAKVRTFLLKGRDRMRGRLPHALHAPGVH